MQRWFEKNEVWLMTAPQWHLWAPEGGAQHIVWWRATQLCPKDNNINCFHSHFLEYKAWIKHPCFIWDALIRTHEWSKEAMRQGMQGNGREDAAIPQWTSKRHREPWSRYTSWRKDIQIDCLEETWSRSVEGRNGGRRRNVSAMFLPTSCFLWVKFITQSLHCLLHGPWAHP